MAKPKVNRRLGRKLVNYADNDNWGKCLSTLLERKQAEEKEHERLVWLGAKTEDGGDGLLHLAAFSACDASMAHVDRCRALQCLALTLEADMFGVNRAADDGGTALHSAIAAASSSSLMAPFCNSEDTDLDEESSGNESSSYDSEIGASSNDEKSNDFGGFPEQDEIYKHLTSDELIAKSVQILLDFGADPDLPLTSTIDLAENGEDEIERSYAQEAINEQWTSFTLVLEWVTLTGSTIGTSEISNDCANAFIKNSGVLLAMTVLKQLLDAGANPSYPIGASVKWNAFEFLAAASPRLAHSTIDSDGLIQQQFPIEGVTSNSPALFSVYDYVLHLLLQYCDQSSPPLTLNQEIAVAIITNKVPRIDALDDQQLNMPFNQLLPMPQAVWTNNPQRENWTLVEVAVAILANQSVRWLLRTRTLGEKDVINAIETLFSSKIMSQNSILSQDEEDDMLFKKKEICSVLVNVVTVSSRPAMMDRLLLRACGGKWGSPQALHILLSFGAEPNSERVTQKVKGGLKPLHFLAANYRGRKGVSMVSELINSGADSMAINALNETPLDIALAKHNFLVAGRFWEATKDVPEQASCHKSLKLIYSLGEAAIVCQSLSMLEAAVDSIRRESQSSNHPPLDDSTGVSCLLGKLLLCCVDERSGFGNCRSSTGADDSISRLVNAVSIIVGEDNALSDQVCSFEMDEISNHSPIHLLLRSDRGQDLRNALLPMLCRVAASADLKESLLDANGRLLNRVSLRCDLNFGGYSGLSMACALGCEESITTLLTFGADLSSPDSEGNLPRNLLKYPSKLPKELLSSIEIESTPSSPS